MSADLIAGFLSGAALIIAIGAQNAFVLRQGIRREHVLPLVVICASADAVLIAFGIAGLGALIESMPPY
jgi:L-lysine exporter family protein LysE/ArgO